MIQEGIYQTVGWVSDIMTHYKLANLQPINPAMIMRSLQKKDAVKRDRIFQELLIKYCKLFIVEPEYKLLFLTVLMFKQANDINSATPEELEAMQKMQQQQQVPEDMTKGL